MACQDFNAFTKFILQFDQSVEIEQSKDKPLRYNVWETTQAEVSDLISQLDVNALENAEQSPEILRKIENAIKRIKESSKSGSKVQKDIFENENNIEMSIALHELMESVKGEADKARNMGIDVASVSDTGVLPALPKSRIAASIGRKIAFQKGYRFKRATNDDSAKSIEKLYYDLGNKALDELEAAGYAKQHDGVATIVDYIKKEDLQKDFPKTEPTTTGVLSVSLNEKAIGVTAGSVEAQYFLNRSQSNLENTELGVTTDMLRMARHVTQPSTIILPDTAATKTEEELAQWDDGVNKLDDKTAAARKEMYEKPLFVHDSIHDLMTLLNVEVSKTGKSATQLVMDTFGTRKNMIQSLFGLKRSDDFSIDKKESVTGQNLSKTTPLDDLAENYHILQQGAEKAVGLHLPMKIGRNARLYYLNSVLNPHASKQSRYMLTPGAYPVDVGSADFDYLVYQVAQTLETKLTYPDITESGVLDPALEAYDRYMAAPTLKGKLKALGPLSRKFPGVDYVTILTALQAVKDIRNPVDGKVNTQFTVSADATASGGTLTFLQAVGTNERVTEFFERIGLLKAEDNLAKKDLSDIYGLMSNAIQGFVSGTDEGLGADLGVEDTKDLMQDTLNLLFDEGKDIRELSKDPTMTFIYGQGRAGATKTMSRSLADRIIDNLDKPSTREYLAKLFDDESYKDVNAQVLKQTEGLYADIVEELKLKELPQQLFELMKDTVRDEYLSEYQDRSQSVFDMLKKMPSDVVFKVLPAGAVLSGKTAAADLAEFGMPLTKKVEVLNEFDGKPDTVLTRKEKLQKTVMDVSTIHGIDAAQLYHSVDAVSPSNGVIAVHDDVRSSVGTVRAMEKQYADTTLAVIRSYDVHQQIMEAIAAQAPEVAETKAFIKLKEQIDADVKSKQDIIDSGAFNEDTDALIGDGKAFEFFRDGEPTEGETSPLQSLTVQPQAVPEGSGDVLTAKDTKQVKGKTSGEILTSERTRREATGSGEVNVSSEDLALTDEESISTEDSTQAPQATEGPLALNEADRTEALAKMAGQSDIISRYLDDKNGRIFLGMLTNGFMVDEDAIALTGDSSGLEKRPRMLDLNDPKDLDTAVLILEHEIVHANTVPYMLKALSEQGAESASRDIRYLTKGVKQLQKIWVEKKGDMKAISGLSKDAQERLAYIMAQPNELTALAEFIAIMGAETATAAELTRLLGSQQGMSESRIKSVLKAIIARVEQYIRELSEADLTADLDIELLHGALARTMDQGVEFREQQYQEAKGYMNDVDDVGFGPKASSQVRMKRASMDYLNFAVASMLNSKLERKGKQIFGNLHNIMIDRFPIYVDVANKAKGVYDSSPALQQLVHTVTGEGVNKQKKADILAQMAAISSQRTEIINDQVSKINTLSKDLTDTQKADLDILTSQTNLHDYFVLANKLDTAEKIDNEADRLHKEMWKINPRAVRDVEQLVDWNVNEEMTGSLYNLEAKYPFSDGEFNTKLRKLLALKSIQAVGSKKFAKLLKNTELMNVIKDNSVANKLATLKNAGISHIRDSLVQDYYKEPFQIRAVDEKAFKLYEFGDTTGWKVLKAPERGELGIVYQPTIDGSDIAGAFTDMKLASTDINVDAKYRRQKNVLATDKGYKLVLTKEQKRSLGLIEDFGQGLVRSAAHSIAIQESQIIRDELLKKDTHRVIGSTKSITKLQTIVDSDNVDNPWFLKLNDVTYDSLPANIKAKYQPVGSRASNVKEFNENVDLVRKDISHWLLGASAKSLFQNPQLRWATRILKDLVSGAKIGMVVLNPVKIANDNLSNLTYLGVVGVDPLFIAKNYAEISRDFADYSDLQRQIFQLKVQLVSRPESTKAKQRLKALQKRLKNNSIGDIGDKGFVNSLGSDLVSRSADTLSGFQADMHKALEYLLITKDGNKNYLSHFIMQMQKIGFQGEDFFTYLGGIAGASKSTKLIQQELDQVATRIREIKSEDDVINYVSQFTTSPSSEAVRMGSAMTDLTDVLAKETLYRHFVAKGMSPADARIKVLDSFPDYKENMPLAVKQLSDVGIIMFPSFWLRIQKVIYRMMKDRPVNLATELMIQEALGSDINTIFEANVINKSNTFGGLIHTPFEPIGVNSVVPTELW